MKYLLLCITLIGLIGSALNLRGQLWDIPPGSYHQSCSGCSMEEKLLQCDCVNPLKTTLKGKLDPQIRSIKSQLEYYPYLISNKYDIANCWGALRYFEPGKGCDDFIPKGTYKKTCNCLIIGHPYYLDEVGELYCLCKNRAGQNIPSNLYIKGGETGISNCNGQLKVGNC